MADTNLLRLITYNMHGFNQGKELLKEHWLHPDLLYYLSKLSTAYTCFSSSGMADVVSTQILLGRPFGGVAIMVKNSLLHHCKLLLSTEMLIAILVGSIYFSCFSKNNYKELTLDIISQIRSLIEIKPELLPYYL